MSHPVAPTDPADRIAALDILRGLAVLGILAVNAAAFAFPFTLSAPEGSPFAPTQAAALSEWVVDSFFQGKFITLFSMLFGASLFLVGGDGSDPDRNRLVRRRLAWLAVIGVIHGALIWYGDILLHYALIGFIACLMRGWGARRLIVSGLMLILLVDTAAALAVIGLPDPSEWPGSEAGREEARAVIAAYHSGWLGMLTQNVIAWSSLQVASLFYGVATLSAMMLGMGLFKGGVLSGRAPIGVYIGLVLVGGAVLAGVGWTGWVELNGGWNAALKSFPVAISLGYASLLILALRLGGRGLVGWLAPVGQMAFTNYLSQSLIMAALFYWPIGPGLMGQVDRPGFWPIIGVIWAVQILWSALWLKAFRMGPMEWVWRCLTYARLLPIRRGVAGAGSIA